MSSTMHDVHFRRKANVLCKNTAKQTATITTELEDLIKQLFHWRLLDVR